MRGGRRWRGGLVRGWAPVWSVCLLLSSIGCDAMPGRPDPANRPLRPEQVKDFDVLYARNCAGCHGADGILGAARSLRDPLYLAWIDSTNLRLILEQGVYGTLMPAFAIFHGGNLTEEQIGILVTGMRERWGQSGEFSAGSLPPYAAAPGDPRAGAAVYAEFCSHCHGPGGEGGSVPGSIVDPSYLSLMSNQALRSVVVAGRNDLGMPDYRSVLRGRVMSDEQIDDVVAWLIDHRVEFPGQPFTSKEENDG